MLRQVSDQTLAVTSLLSVDRQSGISDGKMNFHPAGWKVRCAECFPYSAYFEGNQSSASPNSAYNQTCKNHENGATDHPAGGISDFITLNGKLEAFKDLSITQ